MKKMQNISIRDYQNLDWSQVLAMMVQTMEYHMSIQKPIRFKSYTMDLLRNYLRELTAKHRLKRGKLLVAEDNDKLVGFIYGEVDKHDKEMKKTAVPSGTVDELYVLPEARGNKIGQNLTEAIEKYFKENGCSLVRLKDVHNTNIPAQKMYEKLGYIPRVIEFAKKLN